MDIVYFAAPQFLWGLASLAIPFLLLLTRSKVYRTTHFSSVLFLSELTKKASTVLEWKKLILLFFRLTLLGFLALAFALPFATGNVFSPKGTKNRMIFLLDASYSMTYAETDGTLFEKAKKEIRRIVESRARQKTLMSLSLFHEEVEPRIEETGNPRLFLSQLADLKPTSRASDFSALLAEVRQRATEETDAPAEVFILSDFSVPDQNLAEHFESRLFGESGRLRINLRQWTPRHYENFSIQSLILPPRPYLPNAEEKIGIRFFRGGKPEAGPSTVRLWLEQNVVAGEEIAPGENSEGTAFLTYTFPSEGSFRIRVESGDDPLVADNNRYAIVQVHEPLQILLIEETDYAYPFQSPFFYLTEALQSYGTENDQASWIQLNRIRVEDLPAVQFDAYDLIAVADIPQLSEKASTQLRYFVKQGGTVLFSAGKTWENREPETAGSHLVKFLGGNFGQPEIPSPGTGDRLLRPVPYDHPILKIFDHGRQGNLELIGFRKWLPFFPLEETRPLDVILWIDSKWPLFAESRIGKGKLYLWTSSLNHEWNDFPKNPLFVPFLFEFMKYALLGQSSEPLSVGDALPLDSDAGKPYEQIRIKNPLGEETTLYFNDQFVPKPFWAPIPGFYEWVSAGGGRVEKNQAACNVVAAESIPAYLELKRDEAGRDSPAAGGAPQGSMQDAWIQRHYFYLSLFWGVLGLLLAEAWLANQLYKPAVR